MAAHTSDGSSPQMQPETPDWSWLLQSAEKYGASLTDETRAKLPGAKYVKDFLYNRDFVRPE